MGMADTIEKISQLLWDQKLDEARNLARNTHQISAIRIEDLRAQLMRALDEHKQLEAVMPPDPSDKLSPTDREKRREKVIQIALDSCDEISDVVYAGDIASELIQMGIEIGVPPNRANTTIGTILSRSGKFESIGPGAYRRQITINEL